MHFFVDLLFTVRMVLMMKNKSAKVPRLVFQPTPSEAQKIAHKTKTAFLKTPHQWVAQVVRQKLSEK